MRRWRKNIVFWVSLCVLLGFLSAFAFGKEELLEIRVTRCVRPNLVTAEVEREGKLEKVRIKLAGLRVPFENPKIYRQALLRLQELVEGKRVGFDFALGFSPEKHPWVGYLYVNQDLEEPCIVNAVLICEGLATLDEKTAGRNLLGYLLSMQEKAQEEGLGIWEKTPKRKKEAEEECPSCVIRSLVRLDRETSRAPHSGQEDQE
ncbi:MAG: hypothetical protein ABDK87_03290 [Atribacterota bacterium]